MKHFIIHLVFCVLAGFIHAAIPPDTNVTLLKIKKVTVEDSVIVIIAEQATTQITLLNGDPAASSKGETRDGKPVTTVQTSSDHATFTIKQDRYSKPGGPTESAWKNSLALARKWQEGGKVEMAGLHFYAPDVVIQRHMITSVTGDGYLAEKRP